MDPESAAMSHDHAAGDHDHDHDHDHGDDDPSELGEMDLRVRALETVLRKTSVNKH